MILSQLIQYNMKNMLTYASKKEHFHLYKNILYFLKKGYRSSKEKYCYVNVLPVISEIFGKTLSNQITLFMDQFLSDF